MILWKKKINITKVIKEDILLKSNESKTIDCDNKKLLFEN
jgi:hypothetical protein